MSRVSGSRGSVCGPSSPPVELSCTAPQTQLIVGNLLSWSRLTHAEEIRDNLTDRFDSAGAGACCSSRRSKTVRPGARVHLKPDRQKWRRNKPILLGTSSISLPAERITGPTSLILMSPASGRPDKVTRWRVEPRKAGLTLAAPRSNAQLPGAAHRCVAKTISSRSASPSSWVAKPGTAWLVTARSIGPSPL
jgi:hypothetical protein